MLKIISTVITLALFTGACANEQIVRATVAGAGHAGDVETAAETKAASPEAQAGDTLAQLERAWRLGREQGMPVMVVLRSDSCDRCALLQRYMNDRALKAQLEARFVVLDIDVGMAIVDSQGETTEEQLPAIVLVDTRQDFAEILQTDQLVTFLPSADQPLYDWMENILDYSAQTLAFY
ncbi:MAG: thioredoxin family protein [Gammaproteobacteria bacterium]|nr:thioredoxin family protein [Gammaproteobacteria bacterium]